MEEEKKEAGLAPYSWYKDHDSLYTPGWLGMGQAGVINTSDNDAHGETAVNLFFLQTGLAVPG